MGPGGLMALAVSVCTTQPPKPLTGPCVSRGPGPVGDWSGEDYREALVKGLMLCQQLWRVINNYKLFEN